MFTDVLWLILLLFICFLLRFQSFGTHPNLVRMRYLFIDQLPRLVECINQQRIQWTRQQHAAADPENQEQLRRELQAQLAQEELKQTFDQLEQIWDEYDVYEKAEDEDAG